MSIATQNFLMLRGRLYVHTHVTEATATLQDAQASRMRSDPDFVSWETCRWQGAILFGVVKTETPFAARVASR